METQMNIKEMRQNAHMTQHQVADLLGVHVTTVSKWDREVQPVPDKYVDQLAGILDVAPQQIRKMQHEPEPALPRDLSRWLSRVIRSEVDIEIRVALIALTTIADDGVVVVDSVEAMAERLHLDPLSLSGKWQDLLSSGFVKTIGGNDKVLRLLF